LNILLFGLPLYSNFYKPQVPYTKSQFYSIVLLIVLCLSCKSEKTTKSLEKEGLTPEISKDLDGILEDGVLKVSTLYSATSYFLFKGEPLGFEYELLSKFAEYLNVELKIVVANDINNLIPNLKRAKVDLIGYGLTVIKDRQEEVSFSDYLYLNHQVLVQRKPTNWRRMKLHEIDAMLIRDAIELDGKVISIRENTSYRKRLIHLSDEIGGTIKIDLIDGETSTGEIIEMVVDGNIKFTVADNNIANIVASTSPILDVRVPVSFSQKNAWVTRKNSPKLLKALNTWLREFKTKSDYNVLYTKYFKNERAFRKRVKSEFYSLNSNSISQYDKLVKEKSKTINWDWRLLSALIYQESRFDAKAKSWVGAGGLMQMMPATAEEVGVKNRFNAEDNLTGGTTYLRTLFDRFNYVKDEAQRIKLTMASYNCGYSHVIDAQNLSEHRGLDRNKWDNNVEKMILALSLRKNYTNPIVKYGYVRGKEPVTYVKQIFERYQHYKEFIKE
jgi:membrane-bound lytic murein transglycosylase F